MCILYVAIYGAFVKEKAYFAFILIISPILRQIGVVFFISQRSESVVKVSLNYLFNLYNLFFNKAF